MNDGRTTEENGEQDMPNINESIEATPCEDNEPDGMVAYMLAIQHPSRDDPAWPLPSFDARDWAESFCQIATEKGHPGIDLEWMVSWFANALMRGYDEHAMRDAKGPAAEFLFGLLDDIDTVSDMVKGNDVAYRAAVERIQRRRFEVAETDGYSVTFKHRG